MKTLAEMEAEYDMREAREKRDEASRLYDNALRVMPEHRRMEVLREKERELGQDRRK